MCLAVAGRIVDTRGEGIRRSALVRVGDDTREISLAMLPEAGAGDWVTIHAGHALTLLSEEDAARLAELTDEIADVL